jgi:hypothetical protein
LFGGQISKSRYADHYSIGFPRITFLRRVNQERAHDGQPGRIGSYNLTIIPVEHYVTQHLWFSTRWLASFLTFRCQFEGLQPVTVVVQEDSHMGRITTAFLLLSLFCTMVLVPQEWQSTDNRWTDKNNTKEYEAYLLSMAYREHGYYGAKAEIKQAGAKRLFTVDPGRLFRVKDSAARTNEWI